MKKSLFLVSLILFFVFGFLQFNVAAYSENYLPGGVNYLSLDNFIGSDGNYVSANPFLVKPYTDYTFSIPKMYYTQDRPTIEIIFYNNNIAIDNIDFSNTDFSYNESLDVYYFNFKTTTNTNYIEVSFTPYEYIPGYIETYGFLGLQLEEGLAPTAYQAYVEGEYIDTNAPYFQNASDIVSYVDSPITVDEIKTAMIAYDAIDGDVSDNIVILSDNYSENITTLGSYQVVFEVSDKSDNKSDITINVQVVDILKPIFSDLGVIKAVYPNTFSANDILSMMSASDNYDGDITSSIIIVSDNYTPNASITGTYDITFSVSDSSGNTTTYIQTIQVVDEESPIIAGVSDLVVGYDTKISVNELLNDLAITDNYDSSDQIQVVLESDSYTGNYDTLGDYVISYSATDSSGNKTVKNVNISVVDIIGPVVYFNFSVIQVYNDTIMALPDFIELLTKSNEIDGTENYYITVQYDSYTDHASTPGSYHMLLDLKNSQGEVITKKFEVKVLEKPIDYIYEGVAQDSAKESWISKYINYFVGGAISLIAIGSNLVWFIISKKHK